MGYYMYQQGDNMEQAEQHCRMALPLWSMVANDVMGASSTGNLSRILWEQGKQNEARDLYYKAQEILSEYASTVALAEQYLTELQLFWADKVTQATK